MDAAAIPSDVDYLVYFAEGEWRVRSPHDERSYPTQQSAVDAAKAAAFDGRLNVLWQDRDGIEQGRVTYRQPRPTRRSLRSLLLPS